MKTPVTVKLSRDSVCAADSIYDHRKEINLLVTDDLPGLLDRIKTIHYNLYLGHWVMSAKLKSQKDDISLPLAIYHRDWNEPLYLDPNRDLQTLIRSDGTIHLYFGYHTMVFDDEKFVEQIQSRFEWATSELNPLYSTSKRRGSDEISQTSIPSGS